MNAGKPARAVFLDRDGTINVEKDYLYRIEDFEFIDDAPAAIKRLNDAGYLVIVVTNQSGIGRGYYTVDDVEQLHAFMRQRLQAIGARVDDFYLCPHHPTHAEDDFRVSCDCRKGAPGMLLTAAEDHRIDLSASWIVGDKRADVEAGVRAGCRPVLVLTGYGRREAGRLDAYAAVTPVVKDLSAAVDVILSEGRSATPMDARA